MGAPPSLWMNPDWYESLLAVAVLTCTIAAALIRAFIVNPLKSNAYDTKEQLKTIRNEVSEIANEIKSIRIGMEAINSSTHSAHHRIDSVEDRIKRIEDIFFKNK